MAVDYAAKNTERGHEGWALRNAKLRFSRKLLYIAGLLLAYETALFPESELLHGRVSRFDLARPQFSSTEHCFEAARLRPLDLLARVCLADHLALPSRYVSIVFDAYDRFLGLLESKTARSKLAALSYEQALQSKAFRDMRDLGHEFQSALDKLFLDSDSRLGQLTLQYAVF